MKIVRIREESWHARLVRFNCSFIEKEMPTDTCDYRKTLLVTPFIALLLVFALCVTLIFGVIQIIKLSAQFIWNRFVSACNWVFSKFSRSNNGQRVLSRETSDLVYKLEVKYIRAKRNLNNHYYKQGKRYKVGLTLLIVAAPLLLGWSAALEVYITVGIVALSVLLAACILFGALFLQDFYYKIKPQLKQKLGIKSKSGEREKPLYELWKSFVDKVCHKIQYI